MLVFVTAGLGVAGGAVASDARVHFTRSPTLRAHAPAGTDVRECRKGEVLLTFFTSQRLRTLEAKIGRAGRYTSLTRLRLDPAARNGTLARGYTMSLTCSQIRRSNLVVGRRYRVVARATNRNGEARASTVVTLTRARP